MKRIYLHSLDKGWESFDYDSDTIKQELEKRNIRIGNGATIVHSISITGSNHSVKWWSTNEIRIGCHLHSIQHWQANFAKIGKANGYTDEQIAEYKSYIDTCATLQSTIK